jgi:hypothetical protein
MLPPSGPAGPAAQLQPSADHCRHAEAAGPSHLALTVDG